MHQFEASDVISLNERRKKTEIAATVAFIQHLFKEHGFGDLITLNAISRNVFYQYGQAHADKVVDELYKILERQALHEAAMEAARHA